MKVAVFGLGYVGLATAVCLVRDGHSVIGIDVDQKKIGEIASGRSPINEPQIEDLLRSGLASGRLHYASEPRIDECDMAMVCVGTPSAPDGAQNLTFIAEVSRQIAAAIGERGARPPLVVVYRSTIRPGTMENLILPIFRACLNGREDAFELVYHPEFLREAVAIRDFSEPGKIVIGTRDGEPNARMDELNAGLEAPVFYTGYREAEFSKFVDNTFHALKVSFANEIGRVCVDLGLDPKIAHRMLVADTKLNISPAYLRPGGAFGGSCLPKDIRALHRISADAGTDLPLVNALLRSNEAHKDFIFAHCTRGLDAGAKVLMLGLAFKPGSDDLRESPNIDLAKKLLRMGCRLSIYEPSIDPDRVIEGDASSARAHLPDLASMLIDRARLKAGGFDLVIDTNGTSSGIGITTKVVDINTL